MCAGGAHRPSTSTIGVSAGTVSPVVVNGPHTGAGLFLIDKHGWLAGAGSNSVSRGVMHSTVVHHPCRKYVFILARWLGKACFADSASG